MTFTTNGEYTSAQTLAYKIEEMGWSPLYQNTSNHFNCLKVFGHIQNFKNYLITHTVQSIE